MNPYRQVTAAETVEAPSRDGPARLELAPRHLVLDVGDRDQLVVAERSVTIWRDRGRATTSAEGAESADSAQDADSANDASDDRKRRRSRRDKRNERDKRDERRGAGRRKPKKPKRRTFELDGHRLLMARGVPIPEIGLWWEVRPGVMSRIFGVRPPELIDDEAMAAWRALDRMAERLHDALASHRGDIRTAFEVGNGADRVLVTDDGDCLTMYVRRLFREWARKALEVHRDGTVTVAGRFGVTTQCMSRFGVTIAGDYIRFADATGDDRAIVSVPWVSTVEREELARRFGERVHRDAGATPDPPPPWL